MEKIIEVKGIKKKFGDVEAVKGIDFYVEKGKLFAFLGPNGAGKSTTINMLCTLTNPDEGSVQISGFDVVKESDKVRENIGVVFQESLLDPILTVRENLKLRAGFYYHDKKRINEAVEEAANIADVKEFIDRPYGKLSGGQRRRADIARALVNNPKILFMDEPTTGLDPQTRKHLWETVIKLQKDEDMTIFLTTHYMEEAAEADYVVIIDGGQISTQGTPYSLKEEYSGEFLKLAAGDHVKLEKILAEENLLWDKNGEIYVIKLRSTKDAIDILYRIKDAIDSFEVIHGNMDDVFINVTGKEIRE